MRRLYHIFTFVFMVVAFSGFIFGETHFTGKFSTAQEVHNVTTNATGTASCILTDEGLWYYITVEGLTGSINAAHFHNAPMGVDGGVVKTITNDFDGNTATGLWTPMDSEPLTDSLISELYAGNLYFNIHTAANPAGEIRAQLNVSSGTGLTAELTPEQETHSVTSNGSGTASLMLTDGGVAFKLTVDSLNDPINAAHFHRGPLGTNGPVVRTITQGFDGNTAVGFWTSDDSEPLTDSLIADLIAGNIYFNIHTASYPAGEVRGQVQLSGGWGFTANLDTAQQNHPVTNDASGSAALTLTDAGLAFKLTAEGLSGPMTAAHFHNAPAGQDGPVVRTISGDFDGNTASGLWTGDDSEPLTKEMIKELLTGNLYLNVHTAANPAGEIRGQVLLSEGTSLSTGLTDEQEVHTVDTSATGTANFTLTDAGLAFNVTVEGLSGPIQAAHFHNAAAGVDGGVVRTITNDFDGNTASGLWTPMDTEPLTDQLIDELLRGNLYLNIHTTNNPAGEVRGQIYGSGGTDLTASLTPEQEVHNVTSSASGSAAFTLTDAGLAFKLTVNDLSGPIQAAHFHHASAGVDGGVVRTISGDFDGNTASGLWTADDSEPLTDSLRNALLAGDIYLNVHTANNPPGEIRGQVFLSGGVGFTSRLNSEQEVHPVTSDGMGTSALTLSDAGLIFDITVEGLSGSINAAHFHNAPRGQDGPVVRTITDDLNGNTGFGVWRSSDSEPLTIDLTRELLDRNIYYNVHTGTYPMGEIRGQVDPEDLITAIEPVDNGGRIPEKFTLSQNYPNPFNPSTTIKFSLNRSAHTVLTIYNALGQKVSTLVDENLQAGAYQMTFNAEKLSSGVYFYRLEADGFKQTRKMTLMK